MFETEETKEFMSELTGRDCSGESVGAPSYYEIGDHSLPHTDHVGQRSVAYIWHLSKTWKAEYGGGLYWAPEPLANAFACKFQYVGPFLCDAILVTLCNFSKSKIKGKQTIGVQWLVA
mmetsp:Transcript_13655/g.20368  ORF Transcript_13655/g.20368 Transcript_13655/m.20368 type:complete len:118 (-) Transcript_13655:313-666(-)